MNRKRTRAAIAIMMAALLTLGLGTVVQAAPRKVTACVAKKAKNGQRKGATRIVKASKKCKRYEKKIKWNVRGVRGRRGLRGYRGPAGADGASVAGTQGLAGESAYQLAERLGLTNDLSEADWIASLEGEDGASAYDLYLTVCNTDCATSVEEWLDSLQGAPGQNGTNGTNGNDGTNGSNGKSAYELAVENGFTGTFAEWMQSLKGNDGANGTNGSDGLNGSNGKSAYELAVDNGFTGTFAEWMQSLKGNDGANGLNGQNGSNGKSAYELAVQNGFTGTFAEWMQSLRGPQGLQGPAGKSAYEDAVANGFEGSFGEWMASLKGPQGDQGPQGEPGGWGVILKQAQSTLANDPTASITCPDKHVAVGGGASDSVGKGLSKSHPRTDPNGVANGWIAEANAAGGNTKSVLTVFALCAPSEDA